MSEMTIVGASKYTVSEDGSIRSFADLRHKSRYGIVLKPQFNRGRQYFQVRLLHDDGEMRTRYIHQLVAEAFIGTRPEGADIDHINGDKTDNRVSNLRYCTRKENMQNPNNEGLCGWQKYASRKVVAIRDGVERLFDNLTTACKELKLSLPLASCHIRGVKKNCGMRKGRPHLVAVTNVGGYRLRWA